MSFKLSQLATDTKLEAEGKWFQYAPGFKIKIRRINNPDFENYLQKLTKAEKDSMTVKNMQMEELRNLERLTFKAAARHILVDWDGLTDDEGKAIPYSPEKAQEVMLDKRYVDFSRDVIQLAKDAENFREVSIEERQGN